MYLYASRIYVYGATESAGEDPSTCVCARKFEFLTQSADQSETKPVGPLRGHELFLRLGISSKVRRFPYHTLPLSL